MNAVDPVVELTITSLANVLIPAKDCAKVETKPVAPVPAIGILKVCVLPEEAILNPVPEVPVEKNCCVAVKEFSVVIPVAAVGDQVRPVEDEELAVKTKLSEPTFNLINVEPAPTKISPLVYEL